MAMRLITLVCFFPISFMVCGQIALVPGPILFNSEVNHSEVKIRLRCLATEQFSVEPLYIIDGIPSDVEVFRNINPQDIDSITVLKGSESAGFFSCRPNNGVIIITTRRNLKTDFLIKDKVNGIGLPRATLSFVSFDENHDTLRFVANDAGEIVTNRLQAGKIYHVSVTSAGYQELTFHYKAAVKPTETVFLERNIKECIPVIVQSFGRTIRCGKCIRGVRCEKEDRTDSKDQNFVAVYPNPVGRGKTLMVEMKEFHSSIVLELFNGAGQKVFSEAYSGNNNLKKISISGNGNWPAGVYFIQITDEKMKRVKSDKIIFQ